MVWYGMVWSSQQINIYFLVCAKNGNNYQLLYCYFNWYFLINTYIYSKTLVMVMASSHILLFISCSIKVYRYDIALPQRPQTIYLIHSIAETSKMFIWNFARAIFAGQSILACRYGMVTLHVIVLGGQTRFHSVHVITSAEHFAVGINMQ